LENGSNASSACAGCGAGAAAAIVAYVEAHPKGEFGVHRYDLASVGLDAGALRERFAGYTRRYDVPEERPAS